MKEEKAKAVAAATIASPQEPGASGNDTVRNPVPPSLGQKRALPRPIDLAPDCDARLRDCVKVYPDFISTDEESYLLMNIYDQHQASWQSVRNRRLQCFGGDPVPGAARIALPDWLQHLTRFVECSGAIDYSIDHVLLNEYREGQGILPHTDGPSYYPCVACLSVGDACGDMLFQTKLRTEDIGTRKAEQLLTVTLPPRSLVVFSGFAYNDVLHSIQDVRNGSKRISLTMRKILI